MRLNDIEFLWCSGNSAWQLVRWCVSSDKKEYKIVIAFFDKCKEGYDMRTVGNRFFYSDDCFFMAKHAMLFLQALHEKESSCCFPEKPPCLPHFTEV